MTCSQISKKVSGGARSRMFTTSLMFSCSFETRTNIGNMWHAFWGRHDTPLLHVQAHSLPRKVAWHGENTDLDKSAYFLSFPPFPFPLFEQLLIRLYCVVCFFCHFFFALITLFLLTRSSRQSPKPKRRMLGVCWCVLQGSWGGVKGDCDSRSRLTKREE